MGSDSMQMLVNKYKSGEKITISCDFSCLDKIEQADMITLKKWADVGLIEIRAAEELKNEFEQANPNAKLKLEEQYLNIPQSYIEESATLGQCSLGRFGLGEPGTMRDGHDITYYFQEFNNIMFPDYITLVIEKQKNAYYDVMHIATHYIYKRDVFLARDKHFLNKVNELQEKFKDLVVLKPKDCVTLLNQILQS